MALPKVFHQSTKQRGFLLVELTLSMVLLSFISSFLVLTILQQRDSIDLLPDFSKAIGYTKSIIEKTKVSLATETTSTNKFYTHSSFTYITPCLISITASTTWNTYHSHSITLSTLSLLPQEVINLGNDCTGYSSEADFKKILQKSPQSFQINSSITSFDFYNNLTFVGTTNQNNNFVIVSLNQNLKTQSIIGSTSIQTINSLDSIENYTFAAVQGTSNQFQIIETKDPTHPKVIKKMSLPGVSSTGSYPSGLSIFYYNKKIYIGTHRTAGNEFHIYDVSNPENPLWLGSLELNHNINDIVVSSTTAYLATSGNSSDIIVLDVSNPLYIKKIVDINIPNEEDSLKITKLGNKLFIARDKGKTINNPELYVLDCSSTTNPNPPLLKTYSIQSQVTGIKVLNNTMYISSNNGLYSGSISTSSLTKITMSPLSGLDIENNMMIMSGSSTLSIFN